MEEINNKIHVRLLDEPIDAWRSVFSKKINEDTYVILDQEYNKNIEEWEYIPGDIVIVKKISTDQGGDFLAAIGLRKYYVIDQCGNLRWEYKS
jgi:hypothetical protein